MLDKLKKEVYEANMMLSTYDLVTFTWGNVSGIDRKKELIAIKPSGVPYDVMKVEDIVICDYDGNIVEGKLNPSSDLMTHITIYKTFTNIKGIVHTHSRWATSFAQAGKAIPALGTTQADYFLGDIPCTRRMSSSEICGNYEIETGNIIVETFAEYKLNYDQLPGILVYSHGPFSWGISPKDAVHNAKVMEECAAMAYASMMLSGDDVSRMQNDLLNKHFFRKHGKNAYYGQ